MAQFTIKVLLHGMFLPEDSNYQPLDTVMQANGFEKAGPATYIINSSFALGVIQALAKKAANSVCADNSVFISQIINEG